LSGVTPALLARRAGQLRTQPGEQLPFG
jgi:hypothetical protein